MKRLGLCIAMSACAVLAGCSADKEETHASVRPVRTIEAQPSDGGQLVVYTGEIMPRTQTGMAFKSGGRITERRVDLGDLVRPGDTIARLDASDLENQLRSAEAELTNAAAAEATATAALSRQKSLFDKGLVSKAQIEAAQLQYDAAGARLTTAQAGRDIAQEGLTQTDLVANSEGVVTQVEANAGQVVQAGQAVVTIASTKDPEAAFDIPEQLINSGITDPVVKVSLLSNPQIAVEGKVSEVSPVADPATRTYRVRVRLENAPAQMILGAAVSGTLQVAQQSVFQLPAGAISSADGKPAVYVYDAASQTLIRKVVTISYQDAKQIFVGEGLSAGDRVVTAGVSKLRPGQAVRLEDGAL